MDDSADTVRVTTMHGVKGLEFRAVAVTGVTATALPLMDHVTSPDLDENQHRSDLAAQRSLLYVACTRAREALYVSWHGDPSPVPFPSGDPGRVPLPRQARAPRRAGTCCKAGGPPPTPELSTGSW